MRCPICRTVHWIDHKDNFCETCAQEYELREEGDRMRWHVFTKKTLEHEQFLSRGVALDWIKRHKGVVYEQSP